MFRRFRSIFNQYVGRFPSSNVSKYDFVASYRQHVRNLTQQFGNSPQAFESAVGGEFKAFGVFQRELLVAQGLQKNHFVIDVGCGSGRLAKPLADYLTGPYLGIDVVSELLNYASTITKRQDWRFEVARGLHIPAKDESADWVCFFSVLTHLRHEESFIYLKEAKRVLKPTGKIVFSFLEFSIPSHWTVFEHNLANVENSYHLNQFISRDGIAAWAHHLGLQVDVMYDGDKPHIPLTHPVTLDDGRTIDTAATMGQSVCVLSKR